MEEQIPKLLNLIPKDQQTLTRSGKIRKWRNSRELASEILQDLLNDIYQKGLNGEKPK